MLFIYGTLRETGRNRHQIEPYIQSLEPASTPGTIFMREGYRSPFLLMKGATRISGELIRLKNESEDLKKLDVDEGPNYVRVEIPVSTEEGINVTAWAYVSIWDELPGNAQTIDSGDYIAWSKKNIWPLSP